MANERQVIKTPFLASEFLLLTFMQGPKIRLSAAEVALVCDAEIILTKNNVVKKTVALLAAVQDEICKSFHGFSSSPKISKGENYLGLPYVVLDYPRIAKGNDLLFIRSFFWWGNFFSSTLQVAGCYKANHIISIAESYDLLAQKNYFIGINNDPWQHHFEANNYLKISELSKEEFRHRLQEQPHIKIAARWPLTEWGAAANNLTESWFFFAELLKAKDSVC